MNIAANVATAEPGYNRRIIASCLLEGFRADLHRLRSPHPFRVVHFLDLRGRSDRVPRGNDPREVTERVLAGVKEIAEKEGAIRSQLAVITHPFNADLF